VLGALLATLLTGLQVGPVDATWAHWGSGGKYRAFTQNFRLLQAPDHVFWATQFAFTEKPHSGGYIGVQTKGYAWAEEWVDMAIFSVWDATSARPGDGAICARFDGEGEGMSCRIPLPVEAGHRYSVKVHRTGATRGWTAFRGVVTNLSTGTTVTLGDIRVRGNIHMQAPANFVEHFGADHQECEKRPRAGAVFNPPMRTLPSGRKSLASDTGFAAPSCSVERGRMRARSAVIVNGV
jgi:hypothetical protein